MLFSLSVALMIVMTMTSFSRVLTHAQKIQSYDEDVYIAAKQVSQYVLGSQYLEVGESYRYVYPEKDIMTLTQDKGRLVKTPGFEILLTNIDNLFFEVKDNRIYMSFVRENKDYRFLINYAREKNDESIPE